MINSLFPEAGGGAVLKETTPLLNLNAARVQGKYNSWSTLGINLKYDYWNPLVSDSEGYLYMIGDYWFVKLDPNIDTGVEKIWSYEYYSNNGFYSIAISDDDYIYVRRGSGNALEKYNTSGELIWSVATTGGDLTVGANGNIFIWTSAGTTSNPIKTITEYDPDGNLISTITHSYTYAIRLMVDANKNIFAATNSAIMRLDASGNVIWTKSVRFSSGYNVSAIYLDKTGDFYLNPSYNNYPYIQRVSPDGETLWTSSILDRANKYYDYLNITLDSEGNVYMTYEASEESYLFILNGETGELIKKKPIEYYYYKLHCDCFDNIYIYGDWIYKFHNYLGTVYWQDENANIKQTCTTHKLEEGNGYMILRGDGEVIG